MTAPPGERLKILTSAYACEPECGSEPGIGWNIAIELARLHDVWVITRANNRQRIEAAVRDLPEPLPRFAYVDLPAWARFWKRGYLGIGLYYYLWQLLAYRTARRLHRTVRFDLTQHVTFGKYSLPSLLVRLPVPFVWGPVGGGESAPLAFRRDFSWRGRVTESVRDLVRWVGEHDPLLRTTARRATLALAATQETAARLQGLGTPSVRIFSQVGLPRAELHALTALPRSTSTSFRMISVGRLLEWKGFHLGLRAFARAQLADAEYWIIGEGPAQRSLQRLANDLGIAARVHFLGNLPRPRVLEHLGRAHVLLHPSLHEAGGWVCSEAMATGCPVICLDLGGPALQVDDATGFCIPATTPQAAVARMADTLRTLAQNPALWEQQSKAARERVGELFGWDRKVESMSALYRGTTRRLS
jgi:glycosyltransferase involved in cell wall biosynthesis